MHGNPPKKSSQINRISSQQEAKVWERLRRGDTNALAELYDLYIDVLFNYGIQQTVDKESVMDAIHDLFLDLFKYRKNLTVRGHAKFYLLKALKRKLNRKYNSKVIYIDYLPDLKKQSINSIEQETIQGEILNEKNYKLAKALTKLTDRQRQCLFMRFNQERTYEDIANLMGVTYDTARTIVYRALKSLRKESF